MNEEKEIEKFIDSLEDSRERVIMRYRYISGLEWEEVCVKAHYSWKHTHRLHSDALNKILDVDIKMWYCDWGGYSMELAKCKICGGVIESFETEEGNLVTVCVGCGCPYDCKPIVKDDIEWHLNMCYISIMGS